MKIFLLAFFCYYYLTIICCFASSSDQCGRQNGGKICPEGLCCSHEGYCGLGEEYCADCQNNCPNQTNPVPECGWQNDGKYCPDGKCCSQYGLCGHTDSYCDEYCQSNCTVPGKCPVDDHQCGDGVSSIITKDLFEEMLPRRNDDPDCAVGFYNYEAFIEAADFFEGFGTTGDFDTRKRELAAFFGQTSHQTTRGNETDYTWGYCYKKQLYPSSDYCVNSTEWPCFPGKKYYGRGPMQISYNFNYGPCGIAINYNLLVDPDRAENDVVTSFKTAIWFWMTPQPPKPSCHDVMIGKWTRRECDKSAGRVPGYGVITNIINGGVECGKGPEAHVKNRIGFYERYCNMLGVSYGDNLDCYNQKDFSVCPETINGGVAVI